MSLTSPTQVNHWHNYWSPARPLKLHAASGRSEPSASRGSYGRRSWHAASVRNDGCNRGWRLARVTSSVSRFTHVVPRRYPGSERTRRWDTCLRPGVERMSGGGGTLRTVQRSPTALARTQKTKHRRVVTPRCLGRRLVSSSSSAGGGGGRPPGGIFRWRRDWSGVQARRRQRIGLCLETVTAAASISRGRAAPRAAGWTTRLRWTTALHSVGSRSHLRR